MNIATTVLKQPTAASVRLSSTVHRSDLPSVNSHKYHNISRGSENAGRPTLLPSKRSVKSSAKAAPSSVLMESNSITSNTANKLNNNQRRHTFCIRDEALLKILSAPPDEPLYINDNKSDHRVHTDNDKGFNVGTQRPTNLLLQYDEAKTTSPILNRVAVDDNENLPPSDKCVLTNNEDEGKRYFSPTVWGRIQRDLNSPSASCRVRAMDAMKNPTNKHFYSYLNETYAEESSDNTMIELQPKSFKDVMKDVVVYVEVRSVSDNRTNGVKNVIANHGIKVNDRLLKNTTHVVFKDGLQSTFNKARSWNIPIVSILWFEACKKHSVVMDPKAYAITNLERFENPDLYEKAKRYKYIQPDILMQNLHKKIPKAKLLEQLKKQDESASCPTSPMYKTPEAAKKPVTIRATSTPRLPKANTSARRSLVKTVTSKPKNTIRSMFEKQLEKSQCEKSQESLDISDVDANASATMDTISSKVEQINISNNVSSEPTTMLAPGSAHKRLTRRNSMTIQTPTKSEAKPDESPLLNSKRKRRCTMFMPSFVDSIAEDDPISEPGSEPATQTANNGTVLTSQEMDVCDNTNKTVETKCNNVTRDLVNVDLSQTTLPSLATKQQLTSDVNSPVKSTARTRLRRQTMYTPQAMDETDILSDSVSMKVGAASQQRKTMNVNATQSLSRSVFGNRPELESTKSCDAILTPTNKTKNESMTNSSPFNTSMSSLVSTPLIQSMSQVHLDAIRRSTSKSIMDEYKNAYDSKKTPALESRRTLNSIAMDIIRQRVENINRSVQNRSMNETNNDSILNDSSKDILDNIAPEEKAPSADNGDANGTVEKPKPMRRKLFAPPSLFPGINNESIPALVKTDTKKTAAAKTAQKRKRADDSIENKRRTISNATSNPIVNRSKNPVSRRSTLCFETPPIRSAKTTTNKSTNSNTRKSMMVFTSMHQPQIDFINEAIHKLGKFEVERKVSANTTHLITLDARRTVNILRGIARGVWILDYSWITQSVKANKWLPELSYEMKTFSNAVEMSRIERHAFGKNYRMDIFRTNDTFYVSSNCACTALEELIKLCYGNITNLVGKASYIIDEKYREEAERKSITQVHPNWILDSISAGVIQKLEKYILTAS